MNEFTKQLETRVYEAYEKIQELPRPHMGASQLGHACDRWLWLQFRHAVIERHSGRMLLLFRRGHEEESRIVAHLKKVGISVNNTGEDQISFDFGCHVKGSCDGVIDGIKGFIEERLILECKTHSEKSFKDLKESGVKKSKPMHWVQCCVYGFGAGCKYALYFAVNKNTDEIYIEILELDFDIAISAIERGHRIALSDRMPEPMPGASASWWTCKYCQAYAMCWEKQPTQQVNCRTCAHSTPKPDSTWRCERHQADGIPVEWQRKGCDSHVIHPDLVPWQQKDGLDEWTAVYEIDGKDVANGAQRSGVYSSAELLANPALCASGHQFIEAVRERFGGRVV